MKTTRTWGITNQSKLATTIGLCLLLVIGTGVPALAQGEASVANLRLQDGVLALTLEEAVGIALERNLSLEPKCA